MARYADDQFAVVWMGLDAAAAQRAQSRLEMLLGGLDVPDALQQSAEVFTRVAMVHLESVAQKTPDVVEAQLRRALVEAGHAALVAPASVAAGVPLQA